MIDHFIDPGQGVRVRGSDRIDWAVVHTEPELPVGLLHKQDFSPERGDGGFNETQVGELL